MSALARRNGWRGFDNIAERVDGRFDDPPVRDRWRYRCDGMPSMMGCGAELDVGRRFSTVGVKSSGWLVCYGREVGDDPGDDGKGNDLDVVLTFCPKCRAVVESQGKGR